MRIVKSAVTAMAAGLVMLAGGCPATDGMGLSPLTIKFNLSSGLGQFDVMPGEPAMARGTGQLNITGGVAASANISLDLDEITITPLESNDEKGTVNYGVDENTVTITLWVDDFADDDVVCEEGEQIGPYTITLDQDPMPVSIDPEMLSLNSEIVSLLNDGMFSICIEVESTVALNVDINSLDIMVQAN